MLERGIVDKRIAVEGSSRSIGLCGREVKVKRAMKEVNVVDRKSAGEETAVLETYPQTFRDLRQRLLIVDVSIIFPEQPGR